MGVLETEGFKWDGGREMGRGKSWERASQHPVCRNMPQGNLLLCMVIVFESKNLNLSHYIILDPCQVGYINAATELRDNSFLLRVGLWPLTQLAETDLAGSVHCAQEHDAALWEPDMPCCRPWDFLLSRLYLLCKSWLPFSILTNSRFFPLLIH